MLLRRSVLLALLACGWAGGLPAEDRFTLDRAGDRYTLDADRAPLMEILAAIDDHEPARLKLFGDVDRLVSVTYRNQTLDQLLYRLGVSYILVYETDQDGTYRLDDAMVLESDESVARVDPELRRQVHAWIEAMRDDDIPFNALNAKWEIVSADLDCAAAPLFESALHSEDYQQRHLVASALWRICPDQPSARLLDVTLDLLKREGYDYREHGDLFTPSSAFAYFVEHTGSYQQVRSRLVHNLTSRDSQERLLSALLLARHGEGAMAATLVPMLAAHLKDNDLRKDGEEAATALYRLGPAALPYLARYRESDDTQQAEMADLIIRSIEQGAPAPFNPVMYAGMGNPLSGEYVYPGAERWAPEDFPDERGRYPNLAPDRRTARQIYNHEW